ncbi:MAG: biopolymer transporter ExbD [Deltaproteobacteria bacterium]|jgi:biopolymer transport protein ExbD|nr:biopolymer transporter ExbD [Deltaproteobacteria bacterium]
MHQELLHGGEDVQSISDINVTPFIDVMLVLLIIFMVTAPLMMGGVRINLPKTGGTPMARPQNPLIVSLDAQNRAFVDKEEVTETDRQATFRRLALDSESGEVFVRGDGEVKYARMMELMSELGQAGFARVTLVTNVQSGPQAAQPADGEAAPGAAQETGPGAGPDAAPAGASAPSAPSAPSAASPASPAGAATAQAAPAAQAPPPAAPPQSPNLTPASPTVP